MCVSCLFQGIVSRESSNLGIPLHVSSVAHQLFVSGPFFYNTTTLQVMFYNTLKTGWLFFFVLFI
jgi:hypothetical protein